jgi:hypothetical protein
VVQSGKPFTPDMDKTLAEHGLGTRSVIRFRTPGLNGIWQRTKADDLIEIGQPFGRALEHRFDR